MYKRKNKSIKLIPYNLLQVLNFLVLVAGGPCLVSTLINLSPHEVADKLWPIGVLGTGELREDSVQSQHTACPELL